jgi:hypothetical protein
MNTPAPLNQKPILPKHIDPTAGMMSAEAKLRKLGEALRRTTDAAHALQIRDRIRSARAVLEYYKTQATLLSQVNRN